MSAQIRHLLGLMASERVTVQVVSLTMPRTVLSLPFTLLSFHDPSDGDVAFCRCASGKAIITRHLADVDGMRRTFEALARTVMSATDSAEVIKRLADLRA